ncbi:hypothetical protein N7541_008497 [Penicillium brevicompactum]|uniref:Uncharacterized protein n=1 Tax=Penicillium brevicompactum TaxID=5074 RepID=A0A9W9UPI1_PENBR|nr:hypothetical protein N7541_008497 [Penicillium brevicompactum]
MVEYEYASLLIPGFVTQMAKKTSRFEKEGYPKWVSVTVPEGMEKSNSLQIMAFRAKLTLENPGGEGTRIVSFPLKKCKTEIEFWEEAEKVSAVYQNAVFQGRLDMDIEYLFGTQGP